MPLVSTCSAAISAACHRPVGDKYAHLFPVKYGVVSVGKNGVGHCCFTTAADVEDPSQSCDEERPNYPVPSGLYA